MLRGVQEEQAAILTRLNQASADKILVARRLRVLRHGALVIEQSCKVPADDTRPPEAVSADSLLLHTQKINADLTDHVSSQSLQGRAHLRSIVEPAEIQDVALPQVLRDDDMQSVSMGFRAVQSRRRQQHACARPPATNDGGKERRSSFLSRGLRIAAESVARAGARLSFVNYANPIFSLPAGELLEEAAECPRVVTETVTSPADGR